jgi:hypothetical protein
MVDFGFPEGDVPFGQFRDAGNGVWKHKPPPLPLPLLVLGGLLVDDVHASLPADDLVVGTALLDTGSHFHGRSAGFFVTFRQIRLNAGPKVWF